MLRYVELDFEEVIRQKIHLIKTHNLSSPQFIMADLDEESSISLINEALDTNSTLIIIAECSLMYLSDETVSTLLTSLVNSFSDLKLIVFDPIYASDRFGLMMNKNLLERGLCTKTFLAYPTCLDYIQRIRRTGMPNVVLKTMYELSKDPMYAAILSAKAPLDEFEEWDILTKHYFLLVASK